MLKIIEPSHTYAALLSSIGAQSFLESHGSSASRENLEEYVSKAFAVEQFEKELLEKNAVFKLAFYNNIPAGYSKILTDQSHPKISSNSICKMDRLYVLRDFYDNKIGKALFDENLRIAKELKQTGMILNMWTGNARAIRFYEREGFERIGETGFKISQTHSNPNYQMYLQF